MFPDSGQEWPPRPTSGPAGPKIERAGPFGSFLKRLGPGQLRNVAVETFKPIDPARKEISKGS
eukprot:2862486-Pyramimonas_sp.AAC.1